MAGQPEKWTLDGFLSHFIEIENNMRDRSFAFLLGAGASKPSGIPTGAELVEVWLNELHERHEPDRKARPLEKWATADALEIPKFEYSRRATFYPQVFERRFRDDRDAGYAYLEQIMEGAEPSFGYSVLAQILVKTRHSIVITTNFDDLVADALSMFAHKHPLVCGHESLTGFIRPQMRRPLVAKIHRDLLLEPKNDSAGVSELGEGWKEALRKLLEHYVIIAIGYGGNDGSLMGLLEQIEPKGLAGKILWCYREGSGPDQRVLELLTAKKGIMIPIAGFDELMLLLNEKLGFPLQADEIEKQAKVRATVYRGSFEEIQERVKPKPGAAEAKKEESEAVAKLVEGQSGWWGWELKATSESDPEKREQIYRAGLKEFKDSCELMCNFANFLVSVRKKHDEAEELYRRALELAPDSALVMLNLANLLNYVCKKHDEAEEFYRRALGLQPSDARVMGRLMGNLANLLTNVRKKHDEAEQLYRRALGLGPDEAHIMTNFARFLARVRNNHDEAEELYTRALKLAPYDADIMGSFANFLTMFRKNYDEAEKLYRRALELAPESAVNTANFTSFNLARGKILEAKEMAGRAWPLCAKDRGQAAAEVALYRGIISRIEQRDDTPALGRLKTMLVKGFQRQEWSFDDLLAMATDKLSADDNRLYAALAAAILDVDKVAALEEFPRWKTVEPIALDVPWPDGQ
ncbi:tetratricopeptide repeat protein [Candidatus Binatus sp.]|jgi:tetratricopeptide (TPR) repeat protein